MASDERALATWLAARSDDDLAVIFAARGVSPAAGWRDFFDAADGLLDPISIDRALTKLPRAALQALADPAGAPEAPAVSDTLALRSDTGTVFPTVAARVSVLAEATPEAFTPLPDAAPVAGVGEAEAAERAFTAAGALAEILVTARRAPISRTGAGPVSALDRRRLLEADIVDSAEELDDLLAAAEHADLVATDGREFTITGAGERWLEVPTLARWTTVVEGWRDRLPAGLASAGGDILPPAHWAGAYPLDRDWPARAEQSRRIAIRWGLLSLDGGMPEWTPTILAGGDIPTDTIAPHLPAEIDRLYLQADLTAIAPGPLAPALDMRLRRIAIRESRAQASTYRFTPESIAAGLTEDETAESIHAFLAEVSLTGIPQPLDYLVQSTADRHGLVRVSTDAAGLTRVESVDPALVDAIAIDQALRPLGLVADGGALRSRAERSVVFWALADARYPVVAVDAQGSPESLHRRTAPVRSAVTVAPHTAYAPLIATLRARHSDTGEGAWLERELDQAVRAKATLLVTVRLPDASERTFTLEASGLGGGRLRGLDRAADIERTLPISSIVAAVPTDAVPSGRR